jgi:hypothetical protein
LKILHLKGNCLEINLTSEICSVFGAPESGCFLNLLPPQDNLADGARSSFVRLIFSGLRACWGAAVACLQQVVEITCLFHVSAVGVPSWVIGQKSKYKQGNKK